MKRVKSGKVTNRRNFFKHDRQYCRQNLRGELSQALRFSRHNMQNSLLESLKISQSVSVPFDHFYLVVPFNKGIDAFMEAVIKKCRNKQAKSSKKVMAAEKDGKMNIASGISR